MSRLLVICGCLMAAAEAGLIGSSQITGIPAVQLGQSLNFRPATSVAGLVAVPAISTTATAAASSSNIVRGIGPLASIVQGRNLVRNQQGLTTLTARDRAGFAINGYGVGESVIGLL